MLAFAEAEQGEGDVADAGADDRADDHIVRVVHAGVHPRVGDRSSESAKRSTDGGDLLPDERQSKRFSSYMVQWMETYVCKSTTSDLFQDALERRT